MQRAALAALAFCLVPVLSLGCAAPISSPEGVAEASQADHSDPLTVDSSGCREVANVGLAPTANLRPLVPAQFSLAGGTSETTPFVVRTVRCDSVSVDGDKGRPTLLVQIGAVILPPDGDGDINNYTLYYDTDNAHLAEGLAHRGVPARLVPQLEESLALNPDGSGDYRFVVPPPFGPALVFAGPVGAPSTTPIPFTANWWATSDQGTVKMASDYPELFYNGNSVSLTLPESSALAGTLDASTVSSWPALALFDNFPSAHMVVTVR
jgi:hypothetical protein